MSSSIFTQTTGLSPGVDGAPDAIQTGTIIKANVDGQITAFRWYNFSSWTAAETWTMFIWGTSAQGALVQQSYSYPAGGRPAGYQTVNLTTPLSVTAGQIFLVSIYRSSGKYTYGAGAELQSAITSPDGNLTAFANGTVPSTFDNNTTNGRYDYFDSSARPTSSYNGGAYFVDVVFEPTAATLHGSATGTVSFIGAATGHKNPHGSSAGSLGFTGSATGTTPAVATKHGSATGTVSFTGSVTGHTPSVAKGWQATWTSYWPEAGTVVKSGSATGTVTFTGTAVGHKAPHGSATGSLSLTGLASGHRAPHGASTGSLGFIGTVSGHKVAGGAASGSLTFTGTISGHAPVVGVTHGSATGGIAFTGAATGHRTQHGLTTGAVAFTGGAIGHRTQHGLVTGVVAFTGTAGGHAPTVGGASGVAKGSLAFSGTASGHTDHHGSVRGSVAFSGVSTGHVSKSGSATGALVLTGAATGHAPTVGLRHGAVAGSLTFTGSASGHKAPRGSAVGAVSFTASASGRVDRHGSATGTITFIGTVAGQFSKGFPDLTVLVTVLAGWTAIALTDWSAFVDMEEPINAKSEREYLRLGVTPPDDISTDLLNSAAVQVSIDGGAPLPATLSNGKVFFPTGTGTDSPLPVGNHIADIYLATADEKPTITVGFTVV